LCADVQALALAGFDHRGGFGESLRERKHGAEMIDEIPGPCAVDQPFVILMMNFYRRGRRGRGENTENFNFLIRLSLRSLRPLR
jgi:hypothetical protein